MRLCPTGPLGLMGYRPRRLGISPGSGSRPVRDLARFGWFAQVDGSSSSTGSPRSCPAGSSGLAHLDRLDGRSSHGFRVGRCAVIGSDALNRWRCSHRDLGEV
jgi:hypothetical protein